MDKNKSKKEKEDFGSDIIDQEKKAILRGKTDTIYCGEFGDGFVATKDLEY